jgi:hypothetical protein
MTIVDIHIHIIKPIAAPSVRPYPAHHPAVRSGAEIYLSGLRPSGETSGHFEHRGIWRETAEQETLIRPLLRDPVLGREKGRLTGTFN